MFNAEVVICGAGIIGLTMAREMLNAGAGSIIVFDKEEELGLHASGRNSGVLHAGIYYDPDTLKAKMCSTGNKLMQAYCEEHELPLLKSGKVIVARDESELETLDELAKRAKANGATVNMVNEAELAEIEPNAKTVTRALHSPDTAVVSPKAILNALRTELESSGKVRFFFDTQFMEPGVNHVVTNQGKIAYDLFINASGAFADKVAQSYGLGSKYRMLPFKGIYRKLRKPAADKIKGSIYPVPDIRNPFLGVHFTRSVDGEVYLGPTAIPAFSRENYSLCKGLDKEFGSILWRNIELLLENDQYRSVALEEPKKYCPKHFFAHAEKLVRYLAPNDIISSTKVGIRPQLVDVDTLELVMDFVVEKHDNTVHILNAVSPAFTSSMAFAKMVRKEYLT